uniref:JmjC domain-containing protein n=1 Tax=Caenorhabditis tropicalis TaxID=1561998 RepID=A0A1I7U0P3_9PELO
MNNTTPLSKSVGEDVFSLSEIQEKISMAMHYLVTEGKEAKKDVAVNTHFEYVKLSIELLTKVNESHGVNDQFEQLLESLLEKTTACSFLTPYLLVIRKINKSNNRMWCAAIEKENKLLVESLLKLKEKISLRNALVPIGPTPPLPTPPLLRAPSTSQHNVQGTSQQMGVMPPPRLRNMPSEENPTEKINNLRTGAESHIQRDVQLEENDKENRHPKENENRINGQGPSVSEQPEENDDDQPGPSNRRQVSRPPPPRSRKPSTREEFYKKLADTQATKQFINVFAANEKAMGSNGKRTLYVVIESGHDFAKIKDPLSKIHLIRNVEGLGLKVPCINMDNVEGFIGDVSAKRTVINSVNQNTVQMSFRKFLDLIDLKSNKTGIYNCLSFEFSNSQDGSRLTENFEFPFIVRQKSFVFQLEKALQSEKMFLKSKMEEDTLTEEEKKAVESRLLKIGMMVERLPRHEKYLIISMANSLTDVHVDFSASSVFYHVLQGQKVFYVAPPTPENIAIYEDFQLNYGEKRENKKWIGQELQQHWERIQINPGETAIIPAGYIHFVFTPMDSIVIGGNFLVEEFAEIQFKFTRMEERCVQLKTTDQSNLYESFWNLIFSYAENVLLQKIMVANENEMSDETLQHTAKTFVKEMEKSQNATDWYTDEEKKTIIENLKNAISSPNPRTTTSSNTPHTSIKRKQERNSSPVIGEGSSTNLAAPPPKRHAAVRSGLSS